MLNVRLMFFLLKMFAKQVYHVESIDCDAYGLSILFWETSIVRLYIT